MTYIVALTAHTNTQIEEECLKAGMKRVLNKPLTLSVLTEIMWQYYFLKQDEEEVEEVVYEEEE